MKMKRILAVTLALAMGLSMISCSQSTEKEQTQPQSTEEQVAEQPAVQPVKTPEEKPTEKTKVNLAALSGPTALGMLELLEQNEKGEAANDYQVTLATAPDEVVAKVVSGELDIAAVPTNVAATLYNKTQGGVQLAALNTMGVLYIVEAGESIQSVADLKGKTIYSTGQGSTPEYALNLVLEKNGLTVGEDVEIVYASTAEVAALLASGEAEYATLIEPQVTSAMSQNSEVRRALSFEEEWQRVTGTDTMIPNAGFGTTQGFIDENPELTEQFQAAYAESVQWVLDHPAEAAALAEEHLGMKAAVVEAAIPNMGLTFKSAQDAWGELDTFYNLLNDFDPSMIGGKLPNDGLYYAG